MADTDPAGGPGIEPEHHTPPAQKDYGRAGRNLPVAIGVGAALIAAVVLTLMFFNWGFVALVAAGLVLAGIELHQALRRRNIHTAIWPISVGTLLIVMASYAAGHEPRINMPATTIVLGAIGLTVVASLVWRMRRGPEGFIRDVSGSLFTIAYVPLLGSFVALMLAGEQGVGRVVTFILVVVASDIGGYVLGVLIGRHPMAPVISPKKSWEGFVGSVIFSQATAIALCVFVLGVPWWVGTVLGAALVIAGTCGDLVESLIKRDVGIKDMSSFLPGHGGVMDRIDSLLLAAAPAWLVMYLLVPGG
ncbi:phosphatidate cytidylyltransferase [Propionibacteriaceae bacterium Y1685]|uniref:phosphatidate cytidylyltransferase n=1 Tax=Microlunatus sp. Y1700 TaxID=3418487 RepID=UPI003B78E144